jgi:hypothetical protein
MKPRTQDYLTRAESHRAVAIALVDPAARSPNRRPPYEWVLVMVYHAAIDYVQALIFERRSVEHGNHHKARRSAFDREPESTTHSVHGITLLDHYDKLEVQAHQARYALGFAAHPIDVDGALYEDLDAIRIVVGGALGWPPTL